MCSTLYYKQHEGSEMATIQARVPDEIQDVATAVIKATGLTVSDAVRMFMTRIATERALPLDLFQPNAETVQARSREPRLMAYVP